MHPPVFSKLKTSKDNDFKESAMFVVFGATGNTGGATARALLSQGQKVRVVIRNLEKAEHWQQLGAEVFLADYKDRARLIEAVQGSQGIYLMNPPPNQQPEPLITAREQAEIYRDLIALTPRVVVLSSVGAHKAQGTGSIQTLHILEEVLRAENVTFLRPGYFAENWLQVLPLAQSQGLLPSFLQPLDKTVPMVCTEDIGVAAAGLLLSQEGPRIVELTGPSDLSPQDIATQLSRRLNRRVDAVAVPEEQWEAEVSQWGFSRKAADLIMGLYRGVNNGTVEYEFPDRVWRGETEIVESLLTQRPTPVTV